VARKTIDCRQYDFKRLDGGECSIQLTGEEDQLLVEAISHALVVHGIADTPDIRSLVHAAMRPAV
jgi:hypothetical protein